MALANINVTVKQLAELGGASNEGYKIGMVLSAGKVAQNDTWTVVNATQVYFAVVMDDSSGIIDDTNIDGSTLNKIALDNTSTGVATGFLVYR